LICNKCDYIHYINPKIIVGAVISYKKKILLCKRAIEPQKGFWTIPAGYLEENETTEEGALREIFEESGAKPKITALLAVYSLKHISQIQIIYKANVESDSLDPGEETEEARFFSWETIPWQDIAFPSVKWALNHFNEVRSKILFAPYSNP